MMGIYSTYVLPRLLDLAMSDEEMTRLRRAWIPKARGTVLELGIGSGLNLRFYSSAVERVIGVDPSAELQRTTRERARETSLAVDFRLQGAHERLALHDESIDTVVTTWTLCTILVQMGDRVYRSTAALTARAASVSAATELLECSRFPRCGLPASGRAEPQQAGP
jgi:SAM-dependent methyltransferase